MKWLILFLSVLATPLALAETPPRTIKLPAALLCGPYNDGPGLEKEYGEIPFVEGDAQVISPDTTQAYYGKIRIFVNPDTHSYTILFDIQNEISCLLTTGDKLQPIYQGKPL